MLSPLSPVYIQNMLKSFLSMIFPPTGNLNLTALLACCIINMYKCTYTFEVIYHCFDLKVAL